MVEIQTKECYQAEISKCTLCCGCIVYTLLRTTELMRILTKSKSRALNCCWNTRALPVDYKHNDSSVWLMCGVIMKCPPLNVCQLQAEKCEALSSVKDVVLQHVGRQSLSSVDGRGTAAAEKQQSLQSLICKYANERVIKIGRLSVALWLLMNSNLQERRRGWWAKN